MVIKSRSAALGPIMLDLEGPTLLPEEREILAHPLTGGVILFSRNYRTPDQLSALVAEIHGIREPRLLVAVDHEGGSVQRFREGFTNLPAARCFGEAFDANPDTADTLAEQCGWVMALELRAHDVDFSFAPVLDLGRGRSRVIGSRAFHRKPEVVARLAWRFVHGMKQAGMVAVGKHFPGHGTVEADSHVDVPVDNRSFATITHRDLLPFARLIGSGLPAIMPAHVIYPQVDQRPAGFSPVWLQSILRGQLGFQGALFSDDITMAGASVAGNSVERARSALTAGCDMVLVCNDRAGAQGILDNLGEYHEPVSALRLARLHGHGHPRRGELASWTDYKAAVTAIGGLEREPELGLRDDGPA